MRNYWLRIALGALAIFAVGMIGVTLARPGVSRVRGVVEGSGPITLPIMFVPFKLNGQKLGTLNKVVLLRDAPKRISAVELEVMLRDSAVARGLEGCRLAANFDAQHNPNGARVTADPLSSGVFSCLHGVDSNAHFQEFGRAVLQPGNVSVPLLLPNDIVDDLKHGHFDSQAEDSAGAAVEARADSVLARTDRLVDSLRAEGRRRADSTRRIHRRMADSAARR
jgi:hypothetical protein